MVKRIAILKVLLLLFLLFQETPAADEYYFSFQQKVEGVLPPSTSGFAPSWPKLSNYQRVPEYTIDAGLQYKEQQVDLTLLSHLIVTQSSLYSSAYYADKAIDKIQSGQHTHVSSTKEDQDESWLKFDLKKEYNLASIRVRHPDRGLGTNDFRVIAGKDRLGPHLGHTTISNNVICSANNNGITRDDDSDSPILLPETGSDGLVPVNALDYGLRFNIPCAIKARYVWIDLGGINGRLSIADIDILSQETIGWGWSDSQVHRLFDTEDMTNDYLLQAGIEPETGQTWELAVRKELVRYFFSCGFKCAWF